MTDRAALSHAALAGVPSAAGELLIGGMPVTQVSALAGGTPLYAYERGAIESRVAALRGALPSPVRIHYAVKANPMPGVVGLVATLADGLDVASAGELRLALATGVAASDVSFAGPGKRDEEIESAVAAGIVLNVESEHELDRTCAAGAQLGLTPRVALRVNPDFELRSSGLRMGGGARPFGIDAERVPQVLGRVARAGVDFAGLQVYAGSQCLVAEALGEAWIRTFELAIRLLDGIGLACPTLNVGGGFGIPYFPGDEPLDLQRAGALLGPHVETLERARPETRVVLELGRYLVGEAGTYVCRVIERKRSRGELFLITDGGLHHNLAASGNFGQVLRRNYPVCVATRMDAPPGEPATVVGPLCTPLDVLAHRMPLADAEPGDLIAIRQSGAYGPSASPTAFLGHPPPAEILI